MSRLIIKGLPANCTENKLRQFFKKYGDLTDCSLKYTKEGKFRKFAFIGFNDDETSRKAAEATHNTYLDSSRVQVEECRPFGDDTKPRSWSKYAKDSSAYKRTHCDEHVEVSNKSGKNNKDKKVGKESMDPEFKKFLDAKGGTKSDEKVNLEIPSDSEKMDPKLMEELMEGIVGDTNLSLNFYGLPPSIKQKSMKEWLAPIRIKAMKLARNEKQAAAFVSFNRGPDVRRALQRNGEFLGGFKVSVQKVQETDGMEVEDENGQHHKKEKKQQNVAIIKDESTESRETEETRVRNEILETGRLFLRNLPFTTKEDDLRFEFKKYGEISDVQVVIDKKSGNCKGFAIVEFVFPESAVAAYSSMDGRIFKGRMLHIIPGAEKRQTEEEEKKNGTDRNSASSFKKDKEKNLKSNAGKATHSWNALFLGPNAVADTLAEKLGVGKADILMAEQGQSAGVRLALAETRLVRETRDFLVNNGVCLDAFSRPAAKRSEAVILVKNLPAGVQCEELTRMFEKHGECKVLLPPEGGVSAIVKMNNSADAKKAFKALAYSRFRTQPLYLEWAPVDVFGTKEQENSNLTEKVEGADNEDIQGKQDRKRRGEELTEDEKKVLRKSKKHRIEEPEPMIEKNEDEEEECMKTKELAENEITEEVENSEEQEVEPESTIFCKNLNFETTDESLDRLFRNQKHRFKFAQISKKLNPADPSKYLSMGFGFVQFYTKAEAEKAMKEMQGCLLDGHCLEMKISHREVQEESCTKRKAVKNTEQGKCTKLLVRNLPFQASVKEIEELFATFGEIKSIRIPRKLGSRDQHRGFGFVDFLSVGEAKRAFEALVHSTHLYGRRLVLEWAKMDDSVEELREKTASKFNGCEKAHRSMKKRMENISKDLDRIEKGD